MIPFSAAEIIEEIQAFARLSVHAAVAEAVTGMQTLGAPEMGTLAPSGDGRHGLLPRISAAVHSGDTAQQDGQQLPAQGVLGKIASGKAQRFVRLHMRREKLLHAVGHLPVQGSGGTVDLLGALGGEDDDVCLIARAVPQENLFLRHGADIVVQVGQGDARFQTDLLGGETVAPAGGEDVLADEALHEAVKAVGTRAAVQGDQSLGIVAERSVGSFHGHSLFQNFSGFEQQILHRAFAYGQRFGDGGAAESVDVVQHRRPAVLFAQQCQLPPQQPDLLFVLRLALRRGDLLGQLGGSRAGFFLQPLPVHVAGHAPHEAVEGVFVSQRVRRAQKLTEDVLGQILGVLPAVRPGAAVGENRPG